METSLHRQLKALYAADDSPVEVRLGKFRIDVVSGGELVEIQHGSFAALRRKVARLLEEHAVRIVKPIVAEKFIVRLDGRGGSVVSRRRSPRRGTKFDLFDELIYLRGLFPHERLAIEVLLVDVEERRYPARRRRRRRDSFRIDDQQLTAVHESHTVRTAGDLCRWLPADLPAAFHTGQLAESLGITRWLAQRAAYCLRHAGAIRQVGKLRNAILYENAHRRAA